MGKIVELPDIKRILDKPGRDWTPEERRYVKLWLQEEKVWLPENQQPGHLLFFALRHLGHRATMEDAEDAWEDFYVERFDALIDHYDPAKGTFWGYLLVSFKYFCWDEAKKRKREPPLKTETRGEEGERVVLELVDEDASVNPQKELERRDFLEALNGCLETLGNPNHQAVFVLRDMQNLSEQETATALDAPQGSIKGWLHRARHQLKQCLEKRGWIP